MGFFDSFTKNIDAYVAEARQDDQIILLDVRTPEEFAEGYIEGAINVPLDRINTIVEKVPAKDANLYVYCLAGGRAGNACSALKAAGYTHVTNIGGIQNYSGPVVKS